MSKAFIVKRKIRFGDCDPGGVLYTPRISYFVVEAILDFVAECFGAPAEKSLMSLGILPPTRAFQVEFLKPMAWDDELEMRVSLQEIRTHAFVFSVNGFVLSDQVFAAELTQVCIHPKTKHPVKVPAKLREVLEGYTPT